ncbi:MAG: transcriptional repressor [Oscillospiraceae bacterium]|nr:transcriptional repressor [Oscillospiraceae bacterium]
MINLRPTDYKTKQKEIILNMFLENKDKHLTAAEIVSYINSNNYNIGTATVYRYLDRLVSNGIIRKYFLDDKSSACYQYIDPEKKCREHFHLKCIECGELMHLDCSYMQAIGDHILAEHGFTVDNSRTVLYGRCKNCEK